MQYFLSEHLDLVGPGSRGRQREPAALFVFPDGTSLLVDVGAGNRAPPTGANRVPDGSRSAGEWIGRYALGWLDDHDQCGDRVTPRLTRPAALLHRQVRRIANTGRAREQSLARAFERSHYGLDSG